jgi:hypothetical protein
MALHSGNEQKPSAGSPEDLAPHLPRKSGWQLAVACGLWVVWLAMLAWTALAN